MLTNAVSSRSLFHLEDENKIYEESGQEAFDTFMLANERNSLEPGIAFPLVKKLLALRGGEGERLVRVVILSRNSGAAGKRIMRSIQHHDLPIETAVFTAGGNRFNYSKGMKVDLFLSASAADSRKSLENGVAAATIAPRAHVEYVDAANRRHVRIALDGDSVIFSSEADDLYREHGLKHFIESENAKAEIPLGDGPFKTVLAKLCEVQKAVRVEADDDVGLEIALVTARGIQSHGRVLTTLDSWGLSANTMVFAGGMPKGPFVEAFGADFFFDDTANHVESATTHGIAAGHVPFGGGGIVDGKPHAAAAQTKEAPRTPALSRARGPSVRC